MQPSFRRSLPLTIRPIQKQHNHRSRRLSIDESRNVFIKREANKNEMITKYILKFEWRLTCRNVRFGQHFANADSSVNVGISPFASLVAAWLNFWPVAPKLNVGFSGSAPIDLVNPANMISSMAYARVWMVAKSTLLMVVSLHAVYMSLLV